LHNTHRIGQSTREWVDLLAVLLDVTGHRAWTYREGRGRDYWIVETTAPFLDIGFDASTLTHTAGGLAYVRGYFDARAVCRSHRMHGCTFSCVRRTDAVSGRSKRSCPVGESRQVGFTIRADGSIPATGGSTSPPSPTRDSWSWSGRGIHENVYRSTPG
jgi:hypothetical protein